MVLGSALMLSIQAFINMAVAVNLIPVTAAVALGERGGTSTLITCAYFGLILSADRFGIGKRKSLNRQKPVPIMKLMISGTMKEIPQTQAPPTRAIRRSTV